MYCYKKLFVTISIAILILVVFFACDEAKNSKTKFEGYWESNSGKSELYFSGNNFIIVRQYQNTLKGNFSFTKTTITFNVTKMEDLGYDTDIPKKFTYDFVFINDELSFFSDVYDILNGDWHKP